jgi:hypothetical protein
MSWGEVWNCGLKVRSSTEVFLRFLETFIISICLVGEGEGDSGFVIVVGLGIGFVLGDAGGFGENMQDGSAIVFVNSKSMGDALDRVES